MGDDPGEVYPPAAGRELKRLNTNNYRITAEDRLGERSLKQKCRDNFAAIELVRKLDAEGRAATDEEKRALVKYVGWGGIPQVFAWHAATDWEGDREKLNALLTPEEYEAARASTLNARYTSATVINGIYEAVQRLGFSHGRILEPAAGIGHFFGLMPEETSARSRLTGIELDPLTASIARKLYPDADIRAQGFEAAALVDGSFDLAISNVPFGDYKAFDPQFNDRNFRIHDYFFAKGIEKVRSGGLIAFITSKGTLEKVNSGLRDYLYDKADFLGAIRLPNTAFKQNANTEVTTDVVFLRELADGEKPSSPPWLKLAEHTNGDGVTFQINEYFAANPHMMLGTMANAGTMYRRDEPALIPDRRELAAALREAVTRLPPGIYRNLAEMFTMQRYMQMTALRRNQLQHFDSWAGTFGETVTTMELSPDGSGYRLQSRFARFVNVPELMQQFRQVADVQTAEMLKLPVPKLDQGRPVNVSAPATPELKKFVEQLVARVEQIKSGKVDPSDDNMLQVTTDGRKAALDLRLVLSHVRESPDSKVNQAVEKIH